MPAAYGGTVSLTQTGHAVASRSRLDFEVPRSEGFDTMVYSVQAFIHNETTERLTLTDSVVDGHWSWPAPPAIDAGTVGVLRTLAGGPVTGTGGQAAYAIGGTGDGLRLAWNNPFVGHNEFACDAGATTYAFWSASSGNHPVVHFVLRPAGSVMTDFDPARDGFKFTNRWPDPTPYSLPPLRGSVLDVKFGNAGSGLCGGMVFSALDYFLANWEIPQQTMPPANEQFPLFVDLVNRLFDSFSVNSVSLMLKLMDPLYPDSSSNVLSDLGLADGRAAVMVLQEWPLIRADLDAGRPSPMFLLTVKSTLPWELGECHQVLAYGYDAAGHDVTLHIYDPNSPASDATFMSFNDGDVTQRIVVTHNVDVTDPDDGHQLPIYCFARMDYSQQTPKVRTPDKPTLWERQHRGVNVTVADPITTPGAVLESGTVTKNVWPNCGEHDFPYRKQNQNQSVTLTAQTRGYQDPVITWRVGEERVDPGDGQSVAFTQAVALDEYVEVSRERPDWNGTVGLVALTTTTGTTESGGSTLTLTNTEGSTNCSFAVTAFCREPSEPDGVTPKQWTMVVNMVGVAEIIDGYGDAIGDCVRHFLADHEAGPPDMQAAGKLMRAQLNRPPDPLWDPDPTMVHVATTIVAEDPEIVSLKSELQRPAWAVKIQHPGDVEIPHDFGAAGAGLGGFDIPGGAEVEGGG
jgi:hypothetical protein